MCQDFNSHSVDLEVIFSTVSAVIQLLSEPDKL